MFSWSWLCLLLSLSTTTAWTLCSFQGYDFLGTFVAEGSLCDGTFSPSSLNLWNKGVSGYIPTELGLLDGLASLIVSDNTLSGTLPTQVGNAAGLTFLSLCAPQPVWGSA